MSYKPASFLDKYDKIIFDLDGVITNEQRYWDAAALTLYQLFTEPFDVTYAVNNVSIIRTIILYRDKIVKLLKNLGVNSNWDLTYVVNAFSTILDTFDTVTIYEKIRRLNLPALQLYDYIKENSVIGGRDGDGYKYLISVYQEWYLGDELFKKTYNKPMTAEGKPGLANMEEPLLDLDKTRLVLETLSKYKTIGIASGRVFEEAFYPLDKWKIFDLFDTDYVSTYTDIINAEEQTGVFPLTKPHYFLFTRSAVGNTVSYSDIVDKKINKEILKNTLAVGDAGADLFSAQQSGMDFLAVLSGIDGAKSRSFFEQNNATYIINNIFDLIEEE